MRRLKSILLLILTLSLLLTLAACKEEEPFDTGTPLTPGEVGDLKNDLENEQEEQGGGDEEPQVPEGPQGPEEPEGTTPQPTTVYWLPKGSVYHSDENCYHIRGKANVESGTVAAATEAGKERLCSACAD